MARSKRQVTHKVKRLKPASHWLFIIVACAGLVWSVYSERPTPLSNSTSEITLDHKSEQHILYGDGRGGGHLYGTGVPCKSEFPSDWSADKILDTTSKIAANDNLKWTQQDNGYRVTENVYEGVKVRVVVDGQRGRVVTSYPTNMKRNPCPSKRPANDN